MSALDILQSSIQVVRGLAQSLHQAPWFGDALGSAIGLGAILAGALYNAKLNRERDRELHEQELASVKAALGTELRCYSLTLAQRFGYIERLGIKEVRVPEGANLKEQLHIESPLIYHSLAHKVGLLPAEMASTVVTAWHHFEAVRNLLRALVAELDRDSMIDPKRMEACADAGYHAAYTCALAADELIGPDERPVEEMPAEAVAIALTRRSGMKLWHKYERESLERRCNKPNKGAPA